MFKVGYSRVDITPTESVPLAGYGNTSQRMSQEVLSPLYSTCVALTDAQDNTVLLFHNDLIGSPCLIANPIRESVSKATGVPFENVIICSTHTHSAPDIWNTSEPSIPRYNATLPKLLTECAVAAMADRKETRGFIAKAYTPNLNFVRHYVLEDGSYKGDQFYMLNDSPYAGHTTQADPEMRLVKFVRQGGDDVIMVNWQAHPHRTGGPQEYKISADIIGTMRDAMEEALGCKFIYFCGGGGNINPFSYIPEEDIVHDYIEHGKALAEHAINAEDSYEEIQLGPIKVIQDLHYEPINRPSPEKLPAARKVTEYWAKTNDMRGSWAFAAEHGFSSHFAAMMMISRHETKNDKVFCPFTAISFGDLGFATVPYEMFDTNAKYVRDFSPFKMTFVSSITNASVMYIPSAYGFVHGCYEAECSQCRPGTGERFADKLVKMLEKTKQ